MIYKIINWFKEGWKGVLGVFMVFQVINHFRNTPDYIKYTMNGKWVKVTPNNELLFLKSNPEAVRDSEIPINVIDIFYSWLIDTLPHWFLKSLPDWFLGLSRITHLICLFVFIYSLIWVLKKIGARTKNSYTESEEYVSNEDISEEEFSYQEEKWYKKFSKIPLWVFFLLGIGISQGVKYIDKQNNSKKDKVLSERDKVLDSFKKMIEIADQDLPAEVDNGITLFSSKLESETIIYDFYVQSYEIERWGLSEPDYINLRRAILIKDFCTHPDFEINRNFNIPMTWNYYHSDPVRLIGSITANPTRCDEYMEILN